MERLEQIATSFAAWLLAAFAGGIGWLIRRVLTNERQIALLEADLRRRDEQRKEDRDAIREVKDDVREIKKALIARS